MFQETKAIAEQAVTSLATHHAVKKSRVFAEIKVLSREEFLLSPYSQKDNQGTLPAAPYYLVVTTNGKIQLFSPPIFNGERFVKDPDEDSHSAKLYDELYDAVVLNDGCITCKDQSLSYITLRLILGEPGEAERKAVAEEREIMIAKMDNAFFIFYKNRVNNTIGKLKCNDDLTKLLRPSLTVSTPDGPLCFKVSDQGNIELLSGPPTLRLAVCTSGVVSHKSHYKSTALTVMAKSFFNKGSLSVDKLNLNCTSAIVNAGDIYAKNLQVSGHSELTNNKQARILVEQKCVIQQAGELKNLGLIKAGKEGFVLKTRALRNKGMLSSLGIMEITALAELHNYHTAVMRATQKLAIHQAPEVVNHGTLAGKQGLEFAQQVSLSAQRFVNGKDGALLSDETIFLRAYQTVNRGKISAKNAILKRAAGDADALTLDNTEGLIQIQKRLSLQQGRIKNTHGKCFGETLRGDTTGTLQNQHGLIQVKKRGRLNIRGNLQNSHGAIIQNAEQHSHVQVAVVPGATSVGIFIQTFGNIHCTNGGQISAVEGRVDIARASFSLDGIQKINLDSAKHTSSAGKISVDDSSRIGGTAATKITGFKRVRFLTAVTGNVSDINSDEVQLWRGILAQNANITQTHGKLRLEDIWKANHFLLQGDDIENHALIETEHGLCLKAKYAFSNRHRIFSNGAIVSEGKRFDNNQGTINTQSLTVQADDIDLLGKTDVRGDLTLYPRRSRRLAESTGDEAHRLRAGNIIFHLPQGETITQAYTALCSLNYRLALTATQPLAFLANQTSLQGDFTVESPVPVKMGDATHFVTVKTEQGNFSLKAPVFDVEQGGVVALNSFIEAPGGFTLGRLIEDPNRKVFATIYGHGNLGNNRESLKYTFLNQESVSENVKIYDNRHLIVMPIAISNGSFFNVRDSMKIIGQFHNKGHLAVGVDKESKGLEIDSLMIDSNAGASIWEAGTATVRGNCVLIGKFTIKRITSTYNYRYHNCNRQHYDQSYNFCNSDAAQLNVQGTLSGSTTISNEASWIHAVNKSAGVHINCTNFTSGIPQRFILGDQPKFEQLKNAVTTDRMRIRRTIGSWGGNLHWGGRYGAGCPCPKYNGDSALFIPYALGFADAISNLEATGQAEKAVTVFSAQESYGSVTVFSNLKQKEGHCSAPGMVIPIGKNQVALGSPNPYYIPPQSPVRDLMKAGINSHITYVNQDLKTTLEQNQTDKFHFMVHELFWFNDAKAQAFYGEIAAHLFVVSEEGVKHADPRAVLSLSPKLLVERVQKETQDVLMRGYIFEGEIIDERLVQQLHHNATEYLNGVDSQTVKDFLSGKSTLKVAPVKPLIYYEPIMNEQNVEVLQPRLYFPPALINEVRAQRGGLFKTNLLLVFPENVTPKQLTQLTQHNPAIQSQLIEFFESHPEERQFLENHAVAAIENKVDAESLAMIENKHQADHPISLPEQALAVRGNSLHQPNVTLSGHFDVGTFACLAEGSVSVDAAHIKTREAFVASLLGNVELKARVERLGNHENFSDILRRTHIEADGILQILAGTDVIFEAAHTQSRLGTHIEALGNILDMPVQLVRQHVQHFHERKCSGTITNVHIRDVPCIHQAGADLVMHAGGAAVLYAPEVEAENMLVTAVENASIRPVAICDQQTVEMTQKKGRVFKRTINMRSASMQKTEVPAKLGVKKCVTIASGKEAHIFMNSSALEHHFWGEVVHLMQGVNRSCSAVQTTSRDALWQKSRFDTTAQTTYTESQISGSIEIHAQRAILDQVRGKTLGFWENIQSHNAVVTYQVLDPQYVHDSKTIQGPSQGLLIVVSLAAGIATFGTGTAIAESAFVTGLLGTGAATGAAVAAGFSALCGQAAVSLLQNEGNPLKAVESLASKETAKSVAIAMISAGVMHEICQALELPNLGDKKFLLEHAQYNFARAGVNVALNMGINNQSLDDALKAGLIDAAVGTAAGAAAQEIGGLRQDGHINNAGHKLLHAALGAVGGTILAGPKGALAGAIGAVVAETTAEACAPEERNIESQEEHKHYQEERSRAAQIGKTVGAATALLAGQNVATAITTATYATENNFLTSGRRLASPFGDYDVDAVEPNDEIDEIDEFEFGKLQSPDDNTFMPLWSLERNNDSASTQKRFQLPSVLPEHDPNPILDHVYGVGRAIERARDATTDALLHFDDTVRDLGVMVWDGYNAISDITFGQSTEGARNRNMARGAAITNAFERFKEGNSVTRVEMGTELVTSCILGGAIGSAPRALISEARTLAGTALKTRHGFIFSDINETAAIAKGHALGSGSLYRAGNTAERAEFGRYWSLEKPVDSTYAARHGLPLDNLPINFIAEGRLKPGAPIITRKAEAMGRNQGGAIEVALKNPGNPVLKKPSDVLVVSVKEVTDTSVREQVLGTRGPIKIVLDETVRKALLEPIIGASIVTDKTVVKQQQ